MKGILMKYNSEVVPLSDEGITDVDTYHDCLRTLHSQAVVEAKLNFVPNRVLGASPPDISPLESLLPQLVRTTLTQLRSGHCRLLQLTRPASPAAYQIFVRSVEWHHTP